MPVGPTPSPGLAGAFELPPVAPAFPGGHTSSEDDRIAHMLAAAYKRGDAGRYSEEDQTALIQAAMYDTSSAEEDEDGDGDGAVAKSGQVLEGSESSLLADAGRQQIFTDALADQSSFVCSRCGGIVACRRREAHDSVWCEARIDMVQDQG